ncbi:MAG: MMPL family protein [Syntrophus sp. (in: bacteria)]|nr:MMPL family protein [Syntrophus sp. (in: bacteria)]
MFLERYPFRWSLIIAVVAILGCILVYVSYNVKIETDILASLPRHDPVLADAYQVIRHLPVQDRLIIDCEIRGGSRDDLVAGAELIEAGLKKSGIFRQVGMQQMQTLFPELAAHIVDHLPLLFDGPQLEAEIAPLLAPVQVRRALTEDLKLLQNLEGIGQTGIIARDPLGIRNLVLARMAQMLPSKDAMMYRGHLLSKDGAHLLIMAELAGPATDSAYARAIPPLLNDLMEQLNRQYPSRDIGFTLTPVGAYRAALDNENAARRDMRMAILLTTIGIALLLIITFPRPLIGLLALIPSTAGAIFALLVCSFLFPSLSILAVGFGGAIMAFTVDLGIAYLLFLDRPCETTGRQAAREVHTAEVLAVLTTIGAFLLLLLSRFRVLAEIGVFAALGATFAFLFVHWIFPLIFPVMPPALKTRNRWLSRTLEKVVLSGGKAGIAATVLLFGIMLFFARPVFQVDINAMNSLSGETLAAEKKIQELWGNLTSRVYMMIEGRSISELQMKNDRLSVLLGDDLRRGVVTSAFLPSDLFPGEGLAGRRAAAWQAFWTPGRVADLDGELRRAGREMGFAPGAFNAFTDLVSASPPAATAIPAPFAGILGIAQGTSSWIQVSMVTPGPAYDAESFFARYAAPDLAGVFDAGLFSKRLGEVLVSLFIEIAVITGLGIIVVVFFFFLDWRLSLIVLAPVTFALVCTLGTLKLLGQPLDIPGIMLWIVIMGMGIDYGIYYVCAYQRHQDERHPAMGLIRQAMFLAGATTLIGFGVLTAAQHAVLKSIGLTSLLGISYSLLGAFLIVPPLVKRALVPVELPPEALRAGSPRHHRRVRLRYRHIEAFPRVFASLKMRLDPMFPSLAEFLRGPRRIIDIGCGYGVPSVWILELFPLATVCGLDPDEERVRVARLALGSRGEVRTGRAPQLEELPGEADTALVLDVIHMLSDEELMKTLEILRVKLLPGGRLIIRTTIPVDRSRPWMGRLEELRLKSRRLKPHYRTPARLEASIVAAGFQLEEIRNAAPGSEEFWFIAVGGLTGIHPEGRQAS